MPQVTRAVSERSPIALTDEQLCAEADALAVRVAANSIRDAAIVNELNVRFSNRLDLSRAVNQRIESREVTRA